MSLTINSLIIADARIQGVTLRPVLGAYELIFGLRLTIYPEKRVRIRVSIIGARITLKAGAGGAHPLGFARSEEPFEIIARDHQSAMSSGLYMSLQPGQLAAIENLRDTGDLDFELLVTGTGIDENGEHQVQDTWRIHIPRSDWIKKLRDAKVRDILLLEVPIPFPSRSKKWSDIASGLQRAEEHFRNGDYHACIGSCRTAIQELGHQKFKKKEWAGPLLSRFAADRNDMTKGERESALWAAIRHYTHQAHHGPSEGGVPDYTRSEAQLVLTLTAAAVAHAQAG